MQVTAARHGPPLVVPHLGSDGIVPRREVVQGHHVWRGPFHLPRRVFFSAALAGAVEARKLRKLECVQLREA